MWRSSGRSVWALCEHGLRLCSLFNHFPSRPHVQRECTRAHAHSQPPCGARATPSPDWLSPGRPSSDSVARGGGAPMASIGATLPHWPFPTTSRHLEGSQPWLTALLNQKAECRSLSRRLAAASAALAAAQAPPFSGANNAADCAGAPSVRSDLKWRVGADKRETMRTDGGGDR